MATRWVIRRSPLDTPDEMLTQAKTDSLVLDAIAVFIDPAGDVQLVCVFTETYI